MVFLFKSNNLWDVLAIYCTFYIHGSLRTYIVDACHTVSKDDAIITTILRSWNGLTSIGFNLNYVKKKKKNINSYNLPTCWARFEAYMN